MMKNVLKVIFLLISVGAFAQENTQQKGELNSADKLLQADSKLSIGGYAQIDYNQPFGSEERSLGNLDVHRLVMLFGYRFNSRTNFITEIEFEHVKEVYVEQAFLQYRINSNINFRVGLMLVPMGIINEIHEPVTFNGVERPLVDKYINPTTWREIGFGFSGNLTSVSVKYQLYLMNGFNGYDGDPKLNGENGLRKGRQKGAESFMSSPNFTFRTEYFGIGGLSIGFSGYFGKTQSTLADGLVADNNQSVAAYDSSRVGISMIGLDAKYSKSGIQIKGQLYYTSLSNTEEYNLFTSYGPDNNDLGSRLFGYYIEACYNLFSLSQSIESELIPFIRFSNYNTHHDVEGSLIVNDNYNNNVLTTGLTLKLAAGAALKADLQFLKSEAADRYSRIFNAGIAVMF